MTSPVDSSDLSDILDPSYYDPTNPASPFYDPTLDPNCTNSNVLAAISAKNPSDTATVVPATTDNTNQALSATAYDADDGEKARRRGLRTMQAQTSIQQDLVVQQLQQQTTNTSKTKSKGI